MSEAPENEIPVAREIMRFLAGPAGRVANPAERLQFKTHTAPYKPEVLTERHGKFINESGKACNYNVITLNQGNFLSSKDINNEKVIINAEFNEDDPEKLAIDSASLAWEIFYHQAG